jgi:hypothetical protein
MSAAQKAVAKSLASHDGTLTFFRLTAKATASQVSMLQNFFFSSLTKRPNKLERLSAASFYSLV